jgi:hypothetical protein
MAIIRWKTPPKEQRAGPLPVESYASENGALPTTQAPINDRLTAHR